MQKSRRCWPNFDKQGVRVVQLTSRDYRDAAHVLKQTSRRTAPRLVPDDEIMTVN